MEDVGPLLALPWVGPSVAAGTRLAPSGSTRRTHAFVVPKAALDKVFAFPCTTTAAPHAVQCPAKPNQTNYLTYLTKPPNHPTIQPTRQPQVLGADLESLRCDARSAKAARSLLKDHGSTTAAHTVGEGISEHEW